MWPFNMAVVKWSLPILIVVRASAVGR
ncbi:hypothetical protein LCGC14_2364480, partial [marine sediment metagenome]